MSILQVEDRIDEESERAKHYLDPTNDFEKSSINSEKNIGLRTPTWFNHFLIEWNLR